MSSAERPRITLVTSNGWGLGHLSREIAIALAMGDRADVTMFSFSRGLPLAARFGLRGEFCPGPDWAWIPAQRWKPYVESRFQAFIAETQPDVVMFDGVAPYLGILNALADHPSISAGWLRRGMWLPGRTDVQLTKSTSFDFVIEPGDFAAESDEGPTSNLDAVRVPPVSLIDVVPMLDRAEAAAELGLDPSRPALLFAMGSGQPGDAADARKVALDRALEHRDWQVGLVSSPLATSDGEDVPGAVRLHGVYPLLRYLTAFDAAVSAAGYNSVHELIPAGVPTVLIPKSASQTDDQIARASFLADKGLALMARDDDVDGVRREVERLLQDEHLRGSLMTTDPNEKLGGAGEIARILTTSAPTGIRKTGPEEWRQPGLKGMVKRTIGPLGVDLVRRMLGRTPEHPPRNTVTLDPNGPVHAARLKFTADLEAISGSSDQPVEHILPGSTPAYQRTRRDLIEEFYEIVD